MNNPENQYSPGSLFHTDEFLSVPGAFVTIENHEGVRIEELLALVGRIASTQPTKKVKYSIQIQP
jgi:hypothetical protein